jgi:pimeloyl-ACP methyl ester carboxylesterase
LFAYRRFGNAETLALPDAAALPGATSTAGILPSSSASPKIEVIPVDNRGVGGSTGVVPDNVTDMARDALGFIDARCSASP